MLNNFITVFLLLLAYAITAGLLIWISVLIINHTYPENKNTYNSYNRHNSQQPIVAEQNNYKEVA